MSEKSWEVLFDSELEKALAKIPLKNVNCRKAYFSGVYFGLIFALACEEVGYKPFKADFWYILVEQSSPTAEDLVSLIKFHSVDKLVIDKNLVPNSGFLHGSTQKYYSDGFLTARDLIMTKVIPLIVSEHGDNYRETYYEFLEEKMKYLDERMK